MSVTKSVIKAGIISDGSAYQYGQHCVARTSTGILHIVYSKVATVLNVYHAHSDDNGATWIGEEALTSNTTDFQQAPTICIDSSDNLHVAWQGRINNTYRYHLWYRKYSGGSWGTAVDIMGANTDTMDDGSTCIAIAPDGTIFACSLGTESGSGTALPVMVQFTDPASPTVTQLESSSFNSSGHMDIAVDANSVCHLVYDLFYAPYYYIYYRNSTNWANPTIIDNNVHYDMYRGVSIIVSPIDGHLHVVYSASLVESNPNVIFYIEYTTSWQTAVQLITYNASFARILPRITSDTAGNLYVIYMSENQSSYLSSVYMKKFTTSWQTETDLSLTGFSWCYRGLSQWMRTTAYNISTAGFFFILNNETSTDLEFYISDDFAGYILPYVPQIMIL